MIYTSAVLLALAGAAQAANQTVIGAYIFSRHGDRTPKLFPPVKLTPLGLAQVVASGNFYRERYISDDNSPYLIPKISEDDVVQSQIYTTATDDATIYNSAQGFLMGLYPPVGADEGSMTLRNGTTIKGVQNGIQFIPIHMASVGAPTGKEEDMAWLQGATGCHKAQESSDSYHDSEEFKKTAAAAKSFYENEVYPFVKNQFPKEKVSFKNAYSVFDILNIASLHNSTETTELPDNDVMDRVRYLADEQQWNLAYNESDDNARSIAGRTLAAQIVDSLNNTLTSKGKSKIGIQFGAYATFMSFFGMAGLHKQDTAFQGVADYASTMVFELLSESSDDFNENDVTVRFLFRNGTVGSSEDSRELKAFPLFGAKDAEKGVAWKDFVDGMNKFSVHTQADWCAACGNSTGVCAPHSGEANAAGVEGGNGGSKGLSKVAAGAIGAVVAIAAVLAIEALIALIAGLRIVKKKSLTRPPSPESVVTGKGSL